MSRLNPNVMRRNLRVSFLKTVMLLLFVFGNLLRPWFSPFQPLVLIFVFAVLTVIWRSFVFVFFVVVKTIGSVRWGCRRTVPIRKRRQVALNLKKRFSTSLEKSWKLRVIGHSRCGSGSVTALRWNLSRNVMLIRKVVILRIGVFLMTLAVFRRRGLLANQDLLFVLLIVLLKRVVLPLILTGLITRKFIILWR